ncbi:hypothetical protein EC973_001713 [Apophysomyces ossiformis]|uniref:G-protein coupled receptors family 2 profile 2 domain-containing protein n=1 Tax=Apophysomyces ossiformis TaxID=679940 RepID=A0A8H7EM71_9FUNG|nr:hypothetical protein EC973_001713 [Apophysomyces ossiformis]
MICMALAMVGLNLTVIILLKLAAPESLEKYYFAAIFLVGILTFSIPLGVNSPFTDRNQCWYQYYYYGDSTRDFTWLWYYSWILFASLFAVICSAITIWRLTKEKDNFAGTLNMRRSSRSTDTFRRGPVDRKEAFKKIVGHCVYYPIVPILCRVWGVAIEFLLVQEKSVPFGLFLIDRVFSSVQGVMIAIIYFTDPAVIDVGREYLLYIRSCYVDDYYYVHFSCEKEPVAEHTEEEGYQQEMPNVAGPSRQQPEWTSATKETKQELYTVNLTDRCIYIRDLARLVNKQRMIKLNPCQRSKKSLPVSTALRHWYPLTRICRGERRPFSERLPMRRVHHTSILSFDWESETSVNTATKGGQNANIARPITSDTFKPYFFPPFARAFHWLLAHVLGLSPRYEPEALEEEIPSPAPHPYDRGPTDEFPKAEPSTSLPLPIQTTTTTPSDTQPTTASSILSTLPPTSSSSPAPRTSASPAVPGTGRRPTEGPIRKGAWAPFSLTQGIHSAPSLRQPSALRRMTGLGSLAAWRAEKAAAHLDTESEMEVSSGMESEASEPAQRPAEEQQEQPRIISTAPRFQLSPPPPLRRPRGGGEEEEEQEEAEGENLPFRPIAPIQMVRPPTFVESDVGVVRDILLFVPPLSPSPSTPPPPPPPPPPTRVASAKQKGKQPLHHQRSAPHRIAGGSRKGKERSSDYSDDGDTLGSSSWRVPSRSGWTPPLPDHRQGSPSIRSQRRDHGHSIESPSSSVKQEDEENL